MPHHITFQLVLRLLAWLIPVLWILRVLDAARSINSLHDLTLPAYNLVPRAETRLTIIVPARNEEAKIAACLESLLAQDYPVQIIAVDDRSTDATGLVMDRYAGPSLTKLEIAELPGGWLGKTHAMAGAANYALTHHQPDYLLFTDADILFHPEALRRALAHALVTRADHLVLGPTTIIRRWDEAALLSFFQIFGIWVARPWKVADPAARDAIGIGAFNLLRAEAYRQIGGFEALSMEIVEDLAIARRVKAFGLRQRFAYGLNLVSVHWAAGIPGLAGVMTKNVFAGTNYQVSMLLIGCVWLWFFCIGPFVALAFHPTSIPNALTVVTIAYGYLLLSRLSGRSAWNFLFTPLAAAVFIFIPAAIDDDDAPPRRRGVAGHLLSARRAAQKRRPPGTAEAAMIPTLSWSGQSPEPMRSIAAR